MSTRCTTRFFDRSGKEFTCIFRHHDGYPSGHGAELAEFLNSRVIVNGLTSTRIPGKEKANGIGRLASQFICWFEDDEPAIYPPKQKCDDDYSYEVHPGKAAEHGEPFGVGRLVVKEVHCGPGPRARYRSKTLYDGPWDGFGKWLKKYESEDSE